MKRILGCILLFLIGFSGCQAFTPRTTLPASTQTLMEEPGSMNLSLQATMTLTTPTTAPATSTPTLIPSGTPTSFIKSTELVSSTTIIDLTQEIEIYRRSYCGICHTLTIAETTGTFGPTQDNISAIAEQRIRDPNYTGSASNARDYLLESLVDPQVYIVAGYELSRHKMPPFTHLSREELEAIVYLLLQQE